MCTSREICAIGAHTCLASALLRMHPSKGAEISRSSAFFCAQNPPKGAGRGSTSLRLEEKIASAVAQIYFRLQGRQRSAIIYIKNAISFNSLDQMAGREESLALEDHSKDADLIWYLL